MTLERAVGTPASARSRRVFYTGAEELAGVTPEEDSAGLRRESPAGSGAMPVWRYEIEGYVLEKRLLMPHRQNTVYVSYRLLSGPGSLRLGAAPRDPLPAA